MPTLNLSPKVLAPFVAGLAAFVISWITSGSFDGATLTILISTFVYATLGVAAPPAVGVRQSDVERLRRR